MADMSNDRTRWLQWIEQGPLWNFLSDVHVRLETLAALAGVGNTGVVQSVNGRRDNVILDKTDVGLGNVDNTPDASKPVSTAAAAAIAAKLNTSLKGAADGLAELGSDGKLKATQIPDAIVGGLSYQGTWNATTNSPAIPAAAAGNKGWYYKVGTAGTHNLSGITSWGVGDWVISNGVSWDKISQTELVTSVNGKVGDVVVSKADVGLGNVDNTSDLAKPLSTAATNALGNKQSTSEKGQADGYAPLDGTGKVPAAYLPATSLVAGVSSVNGQTDVVNLTKTDLGLGNVNNTSDANKPISTAVQTALDLKADSSALAGKADASALSGYQATSAKGQANGYAGLGSDGKVPTSQLPAAVFGALSYQGTWNANTNTPAIPAASADNKGWYYKVAVAGTTSVDGIAEWAVGDWIVSDGSAWEKVDNTEAVSSVAGRTGAIVLTKTDVGLANVDNTADSAKPVSTAQQTALDLKANTSDVNTALAAKEATANKGQANGYAGLDSASLVPWANLPKGNAGINTQTDNYSLVLADGGKTVVMNKGTAVNLTVPLNSGQGFAVGTVIDIFQYGAGQVTVVATGGVTIRSSGSKLKLTGQYSGATLQKLATDEWLLVGDIAS